MREIYLAGGCFWGTEKYLRLIPGVIDTLAGYANGQSQNPSYEDVCAGSGHAETVKVTYDEAKLTLPELLDLFFDAIDVTSVNAQGHDRGAQYRSGIYYTDDDDLAVVNETIAQMERRLDVRSVIEVKRLSNFYPAEDYHQCYLEKNPLGYCHIAPALFKHAQYYSGIGRVPRYPAPSDDELRHRLTPREYRVTRQAGTERAYSGEYWDNFDDGIYVDVTTGEPLFSSTDKYDAGCGWPSFTKPIAPEVIENELDPGKSMVSAEVRSRSGNAHLGHVFIDGPKDRGGLRYCIDSAALRFIPADKLEEEGYGYLRQDDSSEQ